VAVLSGTGFVVNVYTAQTIRKLDEMRERAMHMKPFMQGVGMIMLKSTFENFEREGRPHKWKPRSVKTVMSMEEGAVVAARRTKTWQRAGAARRERLEQDKVHKARSNKILQVSGKLRQSIVMGAVTDKSVEIGSSLPYARIHQLGGTIKATTVHARRKKALLIPTQYGIIFRKSANIPARKIAARPYLVLQPHDIELIGKMADDYLERGAIG
jgi:phage gpG-like protein